MLSIVLRSREYTYCPSKFFVIFVELEIVTDIYLVEYFIILFVKDYLSVKCLNLSRIDGYHIDCIQLLFRPVETEYLQRVGNTAFGAI